MRRYATSEELAARYRVTAETIRSWARQGKIPFLRASRRPMLFDIEQVDRVLGERSASKQVDDGKKEAGGM